MDRYWVGGTGTWNSSNTTNWSASSGGASGASVPTSADNAIFDANSSGTDYTVTISGTVNCLDVTFGAPATGALTKAGTGTLNIYGNYSIATGSTSSATTSHVFLATSGTKTITTNSVSHANQFTLNGSGGTFQLADDLTMSGTAITITAGTFDGNGQSLTMTGGGATLTGAFPNLANFTYTGTAAKTCFLMIDNDLTLSGTFTCTGNSKINRVLISSESVSTTRTISAATISCNAVDIMDITGAGAGSWDLSAVSDYSGDCGGNTGITFTVAAAQTWSGTSGGSWSTNAWTSRVPLAQDNVSITSAFSASQTITMDMPRACKDLTVNCTGDPYLYTNASYTITIFGSISISGPSRFRVQAGDLYLYGRGSHTFSLTGINITELSFAVILMGTSTSTYTLLSDFIIDVGSGQGVNLLAGTFDANGYDVNIPSLGDNSSTLAKAITFGSGTWTMNGTGTTWRVLGEYATFSERKDVYFTYSGSTAMSILPGTGPNNTINAIVTAATGNVTIGGGHYIGNLILTGSSVTIVNTAFYMLGDLVLSATASFQATSSAISFVGASEQDITSNGAAINRKIVVDGAGIKLMDDMAVTYVITGSVTLTKGTIDLNGNTLTDSGTVTNTGTETRAMTSTVAGGRYVNTLTSSSIIWSATGSGYTSPNPENWTIEITGSTTNTRIFNGNGFSYPTLTYTNATNAGGLRIGGPGNTFYAFIVNVSNSQTIEFADNFYQYFTKYSQFKTIAGSLITLKVQSSGIFVLSQQYDNPPNIDNNNCTISNMTGIGGARWFMGRNSVNGGNNKNLRFTDKII